MEKANGIVAELKELLGEPVVFIKWPKGVKGTEKRWGYLRAKHMTPEYLSKLPMGNIGVALGEVSGDLCAIDVDDDHLVEPFLVANPQLRETLQTRGSRGGVFWIRLIGEYPRTFKLENQSGEEVGEFRSTGAQSIIWGIHPDTKRPYEFVTKKPVLTLEFNSLRWPPEISNPPKSAECTEETEETEVTEVTEKLKSCSGEGRAPNHSLINCVEDALRVSMPHKKRENNACLFKLARAIKALEVKGERFDSPKLESVFDAWYRQSEKFLRDGRSREEYYLEFLYASEKARFPLGGVKLAEAWARAASQPLPSEATMWENPKLRLLIAFLKQLQETAGPEPFYITLRDCAAFLQQENHTTVFKWMAALTKLGYIKVAKPGNERQATRYFYIWSARGQGD
jgi:hypothetical protein